MVSPNGQQPADPWDEYEREGFIRPEKMRATVDYAYWNQGDFGVQLALHMDIQFVEAPVEAQGLTETILFYSIGAKGDFQLSGNPVHNNKQELVGYDELWSPGAAAKNEVPGFVKTSKYWTLVRRAIDIRSGISTRGQPTDAKVWNGFAADWVTEIVHYERLADSTITLPVAIAGQTQAPPQQVAPTQQVSYAQSPQAAPSTYTMPGPTSAAAPTQPVAPGPAMVTPAPAQVQAPVGQQVSGQAPAPVQAAPAPIAAAPAPAQPTGPVFDIESLKSAGWLAYIVSIVRGQPIDNARTIIQRDAATAGNSVVLDAVFNGGLLDWMVTNGWLVQVGNLYQDGPTVS